MYTLIRSASLRNLLTTQAPALLISFVIAEFVYSGMHSFTKECLAFLVTWFVIDALLTGARTLLFERQGSTPAA